MTPYLKIKKKQAGDLAQGEGLGSILSAEQKKVSKYILGVLLGETDKDVVCSKKGMIKEKSKCLHFLTQ